MWGNYRVFVGCACLACVIWGHQKQERLANKLTATTTVHVDMGTLLGCDNSLSFPRSRSSDRIKFILQQWSCLGDSSITAVRGGCSRPKNTLEWICETADSCSERHIQFLSNCIHADERGSHTVKLWPNILYVTSQDVTCRCNSCGRTMENQSNAMALATCFLVQSHFTKLGKKNLFALWKQIYLISTIFWWSSNLPLPIN